LAKARRLRYKANGAEVMVPPITQGLPKHFHTYLPIACVGDGPRPDAHHQAAPHGDGP